MRTLQYETQYEISDLEKIASIEVDNNKYRFCWNQIITWDNNKLGNDADELNECYNNLYKNEQDFHKLSDRFIELYNKYYEDKCFMIYKLCQIPSNKGLEVSIITQFITIKELIMSGYVDNVEIVGISSCEEDHETIYR